MQFKEMDELAFRSSQKIETIQLQAQLAGTKTKDLLVSYSQQTKQLLTQFVNSTKAEQLKILLKDVYEKILLKARDIEGIVLYHANPQRIYHSIIRVFGKQWTKRDIYFGCAGLLIGIFIGISIGLTLRKKDSGRRYMQAIQCNHYLGCESVTVVEDAIALCECGEYDVLVNVNAASIQFIDLKICHGYGRTFRKTLQNIYKQSQSDLPIVLGRDCAGIITDIGSKVKRLEIGDEVWLAVPFWSQGTLSQTVLVSENRVSRKPKNIGFEGASSLPYAGSLALSALNEANLDVSNARNKKILIDGGCTPVGCVLIQLLKHWKALVTTTCYKKAIPVVKALGASDIIVLSEPKLNSSFLENLSSETGFNNGLLKALEIREDIFDVIIQTNYDSVGLEHLSKYCKQDGTIISTLPPPLASDSCGFFSESILSLYVKLKYKLQTLLGLPINEFDETHLCYVTLDKLAEFVEDGYLQTVVDKVYVPEDIERAVNHIQNPESIGSTIITFR